MVKVCQSKKISNEEKKLSVTLMSPFIILMLQSFILYYFNLVNTGTGLLINVLSKLVVSIFFLISFSIVVKRNTPLFLFVYFISIFIFALNYLFYYQNVPYLMEIFFQYFFICLLCFIYSYSLSDMNIFNKVVEKMSLVLYLIGICMGILIFTNKMSVGTYNMSIGYYLLLPTIICIKKFLDNISLKYLILSIFPIIIILAIGSRGPLMCIGVYIFLYQLINIKKLTIKKFMFNLSLSMILILCILYFDDTLIAINKIFNNLGIDSRSLRLLASGELASTSSRNDIYEEVLYQVMNNPFFGIGLTGDRFYTGIYSHNILLEIISSFGVVIGSILIIILSYIVIVVLTSKNKEKSNQLLIWFIIGIVPLFVSGSFLTYYQFWIFLGLCTKFLKESNNKNKSKLNYIKIHKET